MTAQIYHFRRTVSFSLKGRAIRSLPVPNSQHSSTLLSVRANCSASLSRQDETRRRYRGCIMTNNRHQRADYDSCSADYDKRYAAGPTGVTEILQTLAARTGARTILEAACGTGHWLAQLQGCPQKFGLDLSQGMLRQAGQKGGGLNLVRGDAARMLLRPGGALAVIGMDPHRNRDRWYVYDYFTGTHETGLVRYPSTENLVRVMREEGLEGCTLMQGATLHYDFRGMRSLPTPFYTKTGFRSSPCCRWMNLAKE